MPTGKAKKRKRTRQTENTGITIADSIELVDPDTLNPVDWNPQERTEDELQAIERSILRHGFIVPIVARPSDRAVAGGHGRLEAVARLRQRGYNITAVPVVWRECDDAELRALNLALNNAQGQPNMQKVADVLAEIEELLPDSEDLDSLLMATGFSPSELNALTSFIDVDFDESPGEFFETVDASGQSIKFFDGEKTQSLGFQDISMRAIHAIQRALRSAGALTSTKAMRGPDGNRSRTRALTVICLEWFAVARMGYEFEQAREWAMQQLVDMPEYEYPFNENVSEEEEETDPEATDAEAADAEADPEVAPDPNPEAEADADGGL